MSHIFASLSPVYEAATPAPTPQAPTQAASPVAAAPASPVSTASASASFVLDGWHRERFTPPRRPSPLGPGAAGFALPEDASSRLTPPSPYLGAAPLVARPSRRVSDASDSARSASPQSAEAAWLKTQLRDLFVQQRAAARPLSGLVLEGSRRRQLTLDIPHDNSAIERWQAVRFGDACFMAVTQRDDEASPVYYYVGAWPNVPPSAVEIA